MEEVVAAMEVEEGEDILGEGQWWICWWILVILVDMSRCTVIRTFKVFFSEKNIVGPR